VRLFYIIIIIDGTMSPADFLGALCSDSASEGAISMEAIDGSDDDDVWSESDDLQESG
jgi:hypothetical protein